MELHPIDIGTYTKFIRKHFLIANKDTYAVTYTYSTGSFITELLNLEATQGEKEKLPVLWTSYMSGLLSGSSSVNAKLAVEGVNQAFTQSSYLTNK